MEVTEREISAEIKRSDTRKAMLIEYIRLKGGEAWEAWDGDVDAKLTPKLLEELEDAGYEIMDNGDGTVHIHSPFRKVFSWFQRW